MVLFFEYLKKYKRILILALILATINQVFSLLDPQITRIIIDEYATKYSQMDSTVFIRGVGLLLLAFVGIAFISRVAKNFQDYFVNLMTQKVGTDMYADSVKHTFSLSYDLFEDRRSGEVLQKMQKARQDSQKLIESMINIVFLNAVGMTFVLIYAFYVHWSIGLTFFISTPIMGFFIIVISKKIGKAQKEIVKESAELSGSTTETLRNVELVKSLGLEEQEVDRLNKVNEKILQLELKKIKYVRLLSFIQGTIVNAVRASLLFLMLVLLYYGHLTVGEFLSLLVYSFFIFSPLGEAGIVISNYREAEASNAQLREILDIKPEPIPKDIKTIDKIDSIKFENVGFKYNSSLNNSLNNISLTIKKGERVAFAGPSGSGKTTMVKLILGLYKPSSGKITFNGIDTKKFDYRSFRKRIGFVSQETQLFAGTLKENLLFVNPNATDEECKNVLKIASVDHLLNRIGEGLNTKIGEGGVKLSGGEKQRLAIARALLRNPEMIVFDEATSSLDSLTEKEITNTIKKVSKAKKDLIIISIAHRLSTIAHTDRIYVFEKGKIIEQGDHKTLLNKKGLYAALWREQIAED